MSAERCKFLAGRSSIVLATLCAASVSCSLAFAEQLRVDAGPCSPDGDLAAQRAQVSKVLERLPEKMQFVAVVRHPGCSEQHHIIVDITVLPDSSGGQPPPQLAAQPDQDGVALYLRAHGLSAEQ